MSTTPPICPVCNIDPCMFTKSRGYVEWCSPKCRARHPDVEAKRKATCLEKYGDVTSARDPTVKQKKSNTCVERYGGTSPSLNDEVKKKQQQTMRERYGVEYAHLSDEIQTRRLATMVEKYGTTNFGVVQHQCKEVRQRSEHTRIVNWLPQRLQQFSDTAKPLYDLNQFNNVKQMLPYQCIKCNNIFDSNLINGNIPRCPSCYPLNRTNWQQQELIEFIKSLDVSVIDNDRKIIYPKELDIVIPEHNLAIEFNGIYWHSDVGSGFKVDKNYHLEKTIRCESKQLQLLHIFSDEWDNKRQIVQSLIAAKLGKSPITTFARRCTIHDEPANIARTFLDENHIQGKDNASIRLGLRHQGELVALMTFGRPRFNDKFEYEMIRFCCKIGHSVVGGASRLLSHFVKTYTPTSIVSYADRRYSTGNLYKQLNFELLHATSPAYFYVNINEGCQTRLNRVQFQKHKLSAKLEYFDENLTEHENMTNNGYGRVWDCGTLAFVKRFTNHRLQSGEMFR